MPFFHLYARALQLLKAEQKLAGLLGLAALFLAAFQVAQVMLFANFVEALARLQPASAVLVVWAVLGLAAVAASLWLAQHAGRLAHKMRLAMMADFTEHVVMHAQAHLSTEDSRKQTALLMQKLLRAADQLFFLWLHLFREHLIGLAVILVVLPLAFYMNGSMTLLLLFLSLGYAVMNAAFLRRAFDEQIKFEKFHSHLADRAGEVMNNATVIHSYARLATEVSGLKQAMTHILSAQFPILNWWARRSALNRSIATLFLVLMLAFGSYFYGEGQIDLGDVILFAGFALLFMIHASRLSGFGNSLLLQQEDLAEFFNILDAESAGLHHGSADDFQPRSMNIAFKNVRFDEAEPINFNITAGEITALTGDNRTIGLLVAALMRASKLKSGAVTIDGQDLSQVPMASLRKKISFIPRDSGLLHRSVMENLTLGRPGATQEEVLEAVKFAEAHDFIAARRDGFHTLISDGQNFSDAERRQILIARALLKNAPLIIYEDSAESVDDKKLARAFAHLTKGRTVIIVTNHIATLDKAKRVFVFENGTLKDGETQAEAKKPARKKKTEDVSISDT